MKMTEINSKTVEQLTAMLESEGISKAKLSEARESSFLPEGETIKFVEFEVKGDAEVKDASGNVTTKNSRYIQLKTDKGYGCSLSRLQASNFVGEVTHEAIGEIKKELSELKGSFYLKTNTVANAFLQGNQAQAIKNLLNKEFVVKHIPGVKGKYVPAGQWDRDTFETDPLILFALESVK